MSDRLKPFPQIARFPGEPQLTGLPRSAKDSVFLSTPGLSNAMEMIVDLRGMNSERRSSYFKRSLSALQGAQRMQVIAASGELAIGKLTYSDELKRDAIQLSERLQPEIKQKIKAPFNNDTLEALRETAAFASHLDVFSDYLASSAEKRNRLIAIYSRSLFLNSGNLLSHALAEKQISESLDADMVSPVGEVIFYNEYNQNLLGALQSLTARPELAQMENNDLVDWLKLLCTETKYQPIAEKLLASWLNVRDLDTAVDRIHQLATAAYTSENEIIQRKMLEITALNTNIMPIDSLAAIRYVASVTSFWPKAWQKRREIDDAERVIFPWLAFKSRLHQKRQIGTGADAEFSAKVRPNILARGQDEVDRAKDTVFRESVIGVWRRMRPKKTVAELDDDPIMTDSTLRTWITEKISERYATKKLSRGRKMSGAIQLPGISRPIQAPLPQVVSEVVNALSKVDEQELKRPEHWRTLALLVPPELDQKQLDKLNGANSAMLHDIQEARLRGVSQRGDLIFMTSSRLQELGFRAIEIYPQQKGYEVIVDVKGKSFTGKLDKEMQLVDTRFNSPLKLPITGAFLTHIIICHIHELLCSQFDFDKDDSNSSEFKRQFYSRRDHRRILPEGEKPTKSQTVKALHDYGVDLVVRNKERMDSGETRFMTWVSAVDRIDMAGTGPIESYAINATHELDKILTK